MAFKTMKERSAMLPRGSWWSRQSQKRKWTIIAIASAIVLLALGLGLGLGLTLGGGDDEKDDGALPKPLPAPPAGRNIWQPSVGQSWQIVLMGPIKLAENATIVTPDVDIYDIDLFTTNQTTIDALHRLGKKVICYFSAGSYEPNRPDSADFREADMGKELEGWPGERWLKLRNTNVRNIMAKRIDLAAKKRCDAIDPDNVDGFDNKNGIGLTKAQTVDFMDFLTKRAQTHNLATGLKNAAAVVPAVLPAVQFSVNEQCVQYADCNDFSGFVNASKPVFHIEYPSEVKPEYVPNFCSRTGPAQGSARFSTVIKRMNLDGFVEYCDGLKAETPM